MKVLNLAVVGAFAGGVAGALVGASTMFAMDVLMPPTANAQVTCRTSSRTGTTTWSGPSGSMTCRTNILTGICN